MKLQYAREEEEEEEEKEEKKKEAEEEEEEDLLITWFDAVLKTVIFVVVSQSLSLTSIDYMSA